MHIAILEDDLSQAQLLTQALTQANYQCTCFHSGKELMKSLAKDHDYALIIIDWELPDVSGIDVLHWLRSNLGYNIPVLFVTSRTHDDDIVTGLQAGADDYMCKPFKSNELIARIQALLRRCHPITQTHDTFTFGPYKIDPINGTIALHGQRVELAPKEFELALLLFRNPGRLFSRDVLTTAVWNREIPPTSRTLDTHLSNLRRKLQIRPENGVRLNASYALGYRLELLTEDETSEPYNAY